MILFASDLDNTLIHSYKAAKPGDICVETKDGKELSFMPPEAFMLLKEVAGKSEFVPVTTRSLEQYRRIDLGIMPRYAIVAHGALLLKHGAEDGDWRAETLNNLNIQLPAIEQNEYLYDVRYVDNFFIFAKSDAPERAAERLGRFVDKTDFEVRAVHNKVYILPRDLNKGAALQRLKKRIGADYVICAGDSELDLPMLALADMAISPESVELNNHLWLGKPDLNYGTKLLLSVQARLNYL
ncbi:hypothetical protein FACS1894167_03100 [Synergistales bacterium]|nr:hypothetical protein FACS1894167_03100 [Synergistales bacterium]